MTLSNSDLSAGKYFIRLNCDPSIIEINLNIYSTVNIIEYIVASIYSVFTKKYKTMRTYTNYTNISYLPIRFVIYKNI